MRNARPCGENCARACQQFLRAVPQRFAITPLLVAQSPSDWPMFGQNVANTAATTTPGDSMSAKEIAKLKPKWILTTSGDVSARAAVVNGMVYFPDWGGKLWAVESDERSRDMVPSAFGLRPGGGHGFPHEPNGRERRGVHWNAVCRVGADRMAAGDQRFDGRIDMEGSADHIQRISSRLRARRLWLAAMCTLPMTSE